MTSPTGRVCALRRIMAMLLAVLLAATGFSAASVGDLRAQEQVRQPWTLRDMLFGQRKYDRVEPRRQVKAKARKKTVRRAAPRQRAEPVAPIIAKLDDARVVLVIGDFLGNGLAEGLAALYAENPRVRILDRTSGSSGFVRQDYHNWPRKAVELIDAEKPAVVLVMLGANDRQQMTVAGTREQPRSDAWNREYEARAGELAKAISERKVPLLWVGVPSFKSPKALSDMLAFNDIYRGATEAAGAEFIDIWDGFVDENGAFVTSGPDVNGQTVKLRASDGINLTKAGRRKLAFYTEKPLNKILGEASAAGVASLDPLGLPAAAPVLDIGSIDRTQPISLRDPELDGGAELLGAEVSPSRETRTAGERLKVEGVAPQASSGRADDFAWPPPTSGPAPATTGAVPD